VKKKIILEIKTGLTAQEVKDLRYLLADALGEFCAARGNGNAEQYVAERYPGDRVFAGDQRVAKVAQVQRRLDLAAKLHNAALNLKVV
jgi:hypothetical protein